MKAKKDHFILCGYGRVGREIAYTFSEEGISFVIVDNRQDNFAIAKEQGYLCSLGDATNDKVLIEAGIERARGLVAAMGSDAENIYITLSARGLCPNLFIEARASNKEAETKLKRAGADRVVSPSRIGARRMAMLALRPAVADFIDSVTYRRGRELLMENIIVDSNSPLAGLTIEVIHKQVKTVTLAISKKSGKLLANPPNDATIEIGDRLIIMGTPKELTALECFCEGGQPR